MGPVRVKLKTVNCSDTHHTIHLHAHDYDLQQDSRVKKRAQADPSGRSGSRISIKQQDPVADRGCPTRAFSATALPSFTIPSFAAMTLRTSHHHLFSGKPAHCRHGEDHG